MIMEHKNDDDDSKQVVMSYINALDGQEYEDALQYLERT
jgi:hypothetical protein